MRRILLSTAALAIITSATGCGCCSWLWPKPQPVATPVVTGYPACDACSSNCCDPCAGGVSYGAAPTTTYSAPMTYGGTLGSGGYVSP